MDNFDLKKYLAEGKLGENKNSNDGVQLSPILPNFKSNDTQIMVLVESKEDLFIFKGTGPELLNRCKGLFPDEFEENEDIFEEWLYDKFDNGELPLQFFDKSDL